MRLTNGQQVGGKSTPTYTTWRHMKDRCLRRNSDAYPDYGGRGVTVCPEWMTFEGFVADMGIRPEGASLDRIDVNGNYEPGNCRWADWKTQNRNTRGTKLTKPKANAVRLLCEWGYTKTAVARMFGVSRGNVRAVVTGGTWT